MSSIDSIELESIMARRLGTVEPSKFPDEEFDLYSIPAFDLGKPEILKGKQIGSAKQIVQPGDVLLSRIVPHIRRAWVVGNQRGRRVIASGEWIVFRDNSVDARYLRHYLVSDQFHIEYMRTVSGVGGSLLRARPIYVAKIQIPLPPLPEQKRIAAILDKADAVRRKRQEAIRLTEDFLRSVFLDMFGDPVTNPKGFQVTNLQDICKRVTDGTHQPPKWIDQGIPFLFISNIVNGKINFETKKHISATTWEELTVRCPIERNDILYTTVGSYGNAALVNTDKRFAFQRHIAHIKPDPEKVHPEFLLGLMQSPGIKRQADEQVRGIAQKTLNLRELKMFKVFTPPESMQVRFVEIQRRAEISLGRQLRTANCSAEMFNSLIRRAFRGEL